MTRSTLTLLLRRAVRTRNVDRAVSLIRIVSKPEPLSGSPLPTDPSQGSRRPRFSFFLFSCQRTRCRSDIVRPEPKPSDGLERPFGLPNESTFNTFSIPFASPFFRATLRIGGRRISSPAAVPPSLMRFIRAAPRAVNTGSADFSKKIRGAQKSQHFSRVTGCG